MKKLLFCAALLIAGLNTRTFAQIGFAPEVGVNFSSIQGIEDNLTTKIGLRIGAVVDFPLAKNVHLQPGLFYSSQGGKDPDHSDEMFIFNYIQVPVNVFYHISLGNGSIFVGGGPYFAYAVSAKFKDEDGEEDIDLGTEDTDLFKPTDAGLNIAAGFQSSHHVYVKLGYMLGLINYLNESPGTEGNAKNRNFCVSVGYMIGGGQ